jgi:hypothetical protein
MSDGVDAALASIMDAVAAWIDEATVIGRPVPDRRVRRPV